MTPGAETLLGGIAVLYNKSLSEAPIGSVVSKYGSSVEWVILDNSEFYSADSAARAAQAGAEYIWMGGNRGISAAFNRGIDELLASSIQRVAFFDQDTGGLDAYLERVLDRLVSYRADVLMPLVLTDQSILSPSRIVGPWYRAISRPGQLPKRFSCINSGMIVSRSLLERVRFDERLFLDFVDHRFVEDAAKNGATFEALWECQLTQDYSRLSDSKRAAITRLRIFRRDIGTFYSRKWWGPAWAGGLVLWRVARATVKYRSADFLREILARKDRTSPES